MTLPYISSNQTIYDTPRTSQCWVEYPFSYANDNTTKLYHHLMVMPGDQYEPLQYNVTMAGLNKPLDSLFADDANAFWVEDRNIAPAGNNLITFDRLFAQVPATRTEGAPNYTFTYPSIGTGAGLTRTVSTIAGQGDFYNVGTSVRTKFRCDEDNAVSLNVGDRMQVSTGGTNLKFYGTATYVTIGGFYIIDSKIANGSNFDFVAIYESSDAVEAIYDHAVNTHFNVYVPVTNNEPGNEQRTINSDSLINFRYLKTDDILQERTERGFEVLQPQNDNDHTYTATTTLRNASGNTSGTLPLLDEYKGLIFQGGFISGEPESARRWLGNIWEFQNRRVRAR